MRKSGLKGARVCLIKSMMQRILGTLKFQGLVLGAKFVLTAPRPVERSKVKGRHLLAKQRKLRSEQKKYLGRSTTNRSPGKLFTALWDKKCPRSDSLRHMLSSFEDSTDSHLLFAKLQVPVDTRRNGN